MNYFPPKQESHILTMDQHHLHIITPEQPALTFKFKLFKNNSHLSRFCRPCLLEFRLTIALDIVVSFVEFWEVL